MMKKMVCVFFALFLFIGIKTVAICAEINHDASYVAPVFSMDSVNPALDKGVTEFRQSKAVENRTDNSQTNTTMIGTFITIIISMVTGIIASLVSWLVIKRIRPKIQISDKILLTPSVFHTGKLIPKIKVENSGRHDAHQVDLRGRIFMHGLKEDDPDKPIRYIVNVGGNAPHPYLPRKKEERKEKFSGREFSLRLNKSTQGEFAKYLFKLKDGEVPTLKDCLSRDDRNYIEVSVFSSHAFSFTRGIQKRIYKANDILRGNFENHGVGIQETLRNNPGDQEIDTDEES